MLRTSVPLDVLNPVRTTIAEAVAAPPVGVVARTLTTFVPMNIKCLEKLVGILEEARLNAFSTLSVMGALETGIDSPVSIDSFIIQSPVRSTASHGNVCNVDISITSPMAKSWEEVLFPTVTCVNIALE